MMRMLSLLCLALAACGPNLQELDSRISPAARNAPPPELLPLNSLLVPVDAELPRSAEVEGEILERRGEDLRRRAAQLQQQAL